MQTLEFNHTYDLVDCKWVYNVKPKSDDSLDCYKALRNCQNYGIDYGETIFLVTKMTTVKTPIAIDAAKSWPLFQMDVKNAFLYVDLQEPVFIRPPHRHPRASANMVFQL